MREDPATVVTNLLNPFAVFTAVSLAESATPPRAALFVALELLAAGPGILFLFYLSRQPDSRGFWLPRRADRRSAAGLLLVLFAALSGVLILLDAPRALLAATLSVSFVTVEAAAVTIYWKVGANAAVIGHAVVAAFLRLGPV